MTVYTVPIYKQTLIDGLNGDLSAEYAAITQYTHYAARMTGSYLADQIAILGDSLRPVHEG
jgi:hypothetical protein